MKPSRSGSSIKVLFYGFLIYANNLFTSSPVRQARRERVDEEGLERSNKILRQISGKYIHFRETLRAYECLCLMIAERSRWIDVWPSQSLLLLAESQKRRKRSRRWRIRNWVDDELVLGWNFMTSSTSLMALRESMLLASWDCKDCDPSINEISSGSLEEKESKEAVWWETRSTISQSTRSCRTNFGYDFARNIFAKT